MKARAFKCEWCKTEQYASSEGEGKVYCAYCGQFTKVDKDEDPYRDVDMTPDTEGKSTGDVNDR